MSRIEAIKLARDWRRELRLLPAFIYRVGSDWFATVLPEESLLLDPAIDEYRFVPLNRGVSR